MRFEHPQILMARIMFTIVAALVTTQAASPGMGRQSSSGPSPAVIDNLISKWIDRTPTGSSARAMPTGTEDCAAIYDPVRRRIILFGGKDDNDFNVDETWAFDPASTTWEKLETKGAKPPASEDHTAIYDPIGYRMILYGGENGATTNKLWSLDLKTLTWRNMTSSDVPRRESHSAVYDSRGKRMVIFGGLDRASYDLHEIWAMDLDPKSPTFEKWQNLTVQEGRPPGRIDHAALYDPKRNRMVINAGWTKTRKGLFSDMWAFYFAETPGGKGRWEKVDTSTMAPPERRFAVALHDPERNWYVMFGGQGREGLLNDIWLFDLDKDVWAEVKPIGSSPVPRLDHQAVYDPDTRSFFIYGGDGWRKDGKKLHDVWELQFGGGT